MGFPVSYYCPHYDAVVELERGGCPADKPVTPYPLEGQAYVNPSDDFENVESARFVYGEDADENTSTGGGNSPLSRTDGAVDTDDVEQPGLVPPCSREFYLPFARYEDNREVEAVPESDYVVIGGRAPSEPPGSRGLDAGPCSPGRL